MTRFVVSLVDGDPVVLEGDSLITNFGVGRVVISKIEGGAQDGAFDVTIIEDGEGHLRSFRIDPRRATIDEFEPAT